jgi:hypothetical protein
VKSFEQFHKVWPIVAGSFRGLNATQVHPVGFAFSDLFRRAAAFVDPGAQCEFANQSRQQFRARPGFRFDWRSLNKYRRLLLQRLVTLADKLPDLRFPPARPGENHSQDILLLGDAVPFQHPDEIEICLPSFTRFIF